MNTYEQEYYAIVTKYGFVYDVFEDYSDIDESHELYCIANVRFTDEIKNTYKFRNKTVGAPKYAVSRKYIWSELTVEKWVEEIGGELVKFKTISSSDLVPSNGKLELHETTRYILEGSCYFKGEFPQEYFDSDELYEEES